MECWSNGVLECWEIRNPLFQNSTTPIAELNS